MYHARQELEYAWEERFQQQYGVLRDEVLHVLDEYLNCGLLEHGAARVYCDSCRHSLLVAFSCKKRGVCPSCSKKRAVKFAEHLYHEVLEDVPTRHVVFSIPKRLRPYFRYNRKLCDILFKAAWRSLSERELILPQYEKQRQLFDDIQKTTDMLIEQFAEQQVAALLAQHHGMCVEAGKHQNGAALAYQEVIQLQELPRALLLEFNALLAAPTLQELYVYHNFALSSDTAQSQIAALKGRGIQVGI